MGLRRWCKMTERLSFMIALIIIVLYFIASFVIASLGIKLLLALSLKQFLIILIASLTLLLLFVFLLIWIKGK